MHAMDVHVCESRQHLAQSPWRVAEEPIFADVDSERLRTLGVLNTHTHTRLDTYNSAFALWRSVPVGVT